MSQGNVKNFAAMFNQQPLIKTVPGGPAPRPKPKPSVPAKDTVNGNAINHVNGVHSTGPTKRFTPPPGSFAGIPNVGELSQVKLKKAPPPKPPVSSNDPTGDSPYPRRPSLNKTKPNTSPKPVPGLKPLKPKPAVALRKPLVSTGAPIHSPPLSPTPSSAKSDADDSTSIESSSFSDSSLPRTSTTESNTSRTESSASRCTSGKPEMQVLPPPELLGAAPPKPKKPISVVLPSPTPSVNTKPSNKRSSFLHKRNSTSSTGPGTPISIRSQNPAPSSEEAETDEFYDDIEAIKKNEVPALPRRPPEAGRPHSMIPTIDTDEEENDDELYDDTAIDHSDPPPVPDISRLPVSHGPPPQLPPSRSPQLPRSPLARTPENSGGDGSHDFDLTYDDVSNPSINEEDLEQDELYEAVGSDLKEELQLGNFDGVSMQSSTTEENPDISAKDLEAQRKKEEKQRREQEKLQKKEEERRKKEEEKKEKERLKKEREDKKRREKEEKDAKKKFNIKGDIEVLEKRTVVVDSQPEYADKLDLSVNKGDNLEILRKEGGNPPGKWLARDIEGRYGYVPETCIEVEDVQDVYDDVEGGEEIGEDEEIYDLPDTS